MDLEKFVLKGKEKKRRNKRLMAQQLFELKESVDAAHARRTCEECTQCDMTSFCSWRQGWLLEEHRPDLLGVSMRGVKIEEQEMLLARELRPGALEKPVVKSIAREMKQFMPVLLLNVDDELIEDEEDDQKEDALVTL